MSDIDSRYYITNYTWIELTLTQGLRLSIVNFFGVMLEVRIGETTYTAPSPAFYAAFDDALEKKYMWEKLQSDI